MEEAGRLFGEERKGRRQDSEESKLESSPMKAPVEKQMGRMNGRQCDIGGDLNPDPALPPASCVTLDILLFSGQA